MFSSGWCCSKEKIEDYVLMLRNNSMEKLSIDLFLTILEDSFNNV